MLNIFFIKVHKYLTFLQTYRSRRSLFESDIEELISSKKPKRCISGDNIDLTTCSTTYTPSQPAFRCSSLNISQTDTDLASTACTLSQPFICSSLNISQIACTNQCNQHDLDSFLSKLEHSEYQTLPNVHSDDETQPPYDKPETPYTLHDLSNVDVKKKYSSSEEMLDQNVNDSVKFLSESESRSTQTILTGVCIFHNYVLNSESCILHDNLTAETQTITAQFHFSDIYQDE